ncbi:hypothetical protein RDI58_014682 [Solanum bulbocastanum]|uniref:Uncharacterized protein n=1 Tax=Solanum bulbocastanum TaxID=147425 RepID=A0AAN8TJG5_SOLBU
MEKIISAITIHMHSCGFWTFQLSYCGGFKFENISVLCFVPAFFLRFGCSVAEIAAQFTFDGCTVNSY